MAISGSAHRQHLDVESRRFAELVRDADLDAEVPDCPGWSVRDLVMHTGGLYRWSTRLVAESIVVETWRTQMDLPYPEPNADAAAMADWIDESIDPMLDAFEADGWAPVWTWGQSQVARFWPRRMLFETVVHGLDLRRATSAGGPVETDLPIDVAADCLDELFELLGWRSRWQDQPAPQPPPLGTVVLAPTDAPTCWRVRCRQNGMWWDRGSEHADVTISGPISEMIAVLHQRGTLNQPVGSRPLVVDGDQTLAEAFLDRLSF